MGTMIQRGRDCKRYADISRVLRCRDGILSRDKGLSRRHSAERSLMMHRHTCPEKERADPRHSREVAAR